MLKLDWQAKDQSNAHKPDAYFTLQNIKYRRGLNISNANIYIIWSIRNGKIQTEYVGLAQKTDVRNRLSIHRNKTFPFYHNQYFVTWADTPDSMSRYNLEKIENFLIKKLKPSQNIREYENYFIEVNLPRCFNSVRM